MYELKQVGRQNYYINSPAKIGVYRQSENGIYLIDSGNDKEVAKKVLYGGYPFKELRSKFLLAKESEVTDCPSPDFPSELELIPLPGHFFDMVGVRTPDNTVFLADCVSSPTVLEKYGIIFIYDVAQYLATLDSIETIRLLRPGLS